MEELLNRPIRLKQLILIERMLIKWKKQDLIGQKRHARWLQEQESQKQLQRNAKITWKWPKETQSKQLQSQKWPHRDQKEKLKMTKRGQKNDYKEIKQRQN